MAPGIRPFGRPPGCYKGGVPDVRPFTGLLYDEGAGPLEVLTAPPYDVISPMDQDRLYAASPYNIVRLILGKEEPGDDASVNKYTRGGSALRSWRDRGVLKPTPQPSLFPYELSFHFGGVSRRIRGLIAEVGLEPWGGSIVPHERTMPGPIEDRLALIREVRANLSPVYSVFPDASSEVTEFLDAAMRGPPDREVMDDAGTRHRLWVTTDDIGRAVEAIWSKTLMIADGHHRYTVALAHREEMRERHGPGPWDSTMMFVVDAGSEDPPVLPIHRLVADGIPRDGQDGELVRDMAEVLATLRDEDLTVGVVEMERGQLVHRVERLPGAPPTVCSLHEHVLDRVPDDKIRFVPDSVAAEQAVLAGRATIAYLLPPTRVDRVWSVVRSQARLPQKSTYFWPKPRTGMVIRPLDP